MCLSNSESYNILGFYLYYLFILVSYLIYCFTFLLIGYTVLYYVWCWGGGGELLDEGILPNRFDLRTRWVDCSSILAQHNDYNQEIEAKEVAREVNTSRKIRDTPLGLEDWSPWKEVCQFKPWWFEDAISTWLQMWTQQNKFQVGAWRVLVQDCNSTWMVVWVILYCNYLFLVDHFSG